MRVGVGCAHVQRLFYIGLLILRLQFRILEEGEFLKEQIVCQKQSCELCASASTRAAWLVVNCAPGSLTWMLTPMLDAMDPIAASSAPTIQRAGMLVGKQVTSHCRRRPANADGPGSL